MSVVFVFFTVLMSVCAIDAVHPPGHDPASQPPPEPPIVFDTATIDLGPVPDTQVITRSFPFTNRTDRTIRLIIGGCHHCGVPVADKPQYRPGEKGVVLVELNPIGRNGPMRAGGIVGVEGAPSFNVQLDLLAEVRPRVWFDPEPGPLALAVRSVGSQTRCVVRGRSAGFKVRSVDLVGKHLAVEVSEPVAEGPPGDPWTAQTITISVDPDAPTGTLSGELTVHTTDVDVPMRAFTLSGDVVGDASAEPDPVMLGEREPASAFAAEFRVRSRRAQPVQILGIGIADPGMCDDVALDVQPALDLDGWIVRVVGVAPAVRVMHTDVVVALQSVGADGRPEELRFNTRLAVRKNAPPRSR